MEWSKELTTHLIELFREQRVLWDPTFMDFKNRNKKHDACTELGAELKTNPSEVEKKMRLRVDAEQKYTSFKLKTETNSTEYDKVLWLHNNIKWIYSILISIVIVLFVLRSFCYYIFYFRACVNIHNTIITKLINSCVKFFDVHLSGNIVNRFSRDMAIVDERITYTLFDCMRNFLLIGGFVVTISTVNPYFLFPSVLLFALAYFMRLFYLRTGRSMQRLVGVTKSPIIGQLNASLEGLTTIRASNAQQTLVKEFDQHLDVHNSVGYMYLTTTRGFALFLDMICNVYIGIIIFSFLVFNLGIFAGKVGLAISQAFSLAGLLQWAIRRWAELENEMTSIERLSEYNNQAEPEDKSGQKLENWPEKGRIQYSKVCFSYPTSNELVLKNLDFTIEPKQKIGIVGRTGAGKSSIVSVLFRLYKCSGKILIDNEDIEQIELDLMRSKISMIPQDPVLFSGTLRSNLDPLKKYTDKQLWDSLEEVEMKKVVSAYPEGLDMLITEGGANFSIAQKQLICLARAVTSQNRIVVLDEATSNVDPKTDALIQKTIRKVFNDHTVITIAHKLNTVLDYDKIMVMDGGIVIEFDEPKILLNNLKGAFYKMVKESELLPS